MKSHVASILSAGILGHVEKVRQQKPNESEAQILWDRLAGSCSSPLQRLGGFLAVGFTGWAAATSAIVLIYNTFGERSIAGQGVPVPAAAFYATMGLSLALAFGGFGIWLFKSLRSYHTHAAELRWCGLDPNRPTKMGLHFYSDEQLLALRTRYERLLRSNRAGSRATRRVFERSFGFSREDSFSTGPLGALPGTFEMDALRVEWEAGLILENLGGSTSAGWWAESRHSLLPRRLDEARRLTYMFLYTANSVRTIKRRYGYRADRWHETVPEGKLLEAVRDYEAVRSIQAVLSRKPH